MIIRETKASLDIAVNDLGKKNIGIISIKTDWGVSTSGIVKDLVGEMEDSGAKVVAHEEVIEGSDDYRPAITKLNEAGADNISLKAKLLEAGIKIPDFEFKKYGEVVEDRRAHV